MLVIFAWICTTAYIQNEIVGFAVLSFSIGCEFRLSEIKLSALASISYVGLLFSAHFAGYKIDSSGRRTIMIYSLFFSIIASIASAFMPFFKLILFWRFLNSVLLVIVIFVLTLVTFTVCCSITGVFLSSLLYTMECNKKSIRPFIANGVNYCNGFASILMSRKYFSLPIFFIFVLIYMYAHLTFSNPVVLGFQLHPLSRVFMTIKNYRLQLWRFLMIINCIPGVIGLVVMSYLPESPQFMLSVGEDERAYQTLDRLYISNRKVDLKSIGVTGLTPSYEKPYSDKNIFRAIWHSASDLMQQPHGIPYVMATAIQCGYYFV